MSITFNTIVLSAPPLGHYVEGIVVGTPSPGTCMQIDAAVEPIGGRLSYEVYNKAADGARGEVIIAIEDALRGKNTTDAYVAADRFFGYSPAPGDELYMLVANIAGTPDAFAIGDNLMIDDGTGLLIAVTGTPNMAQFYVMETKSPALTANTLVHCRYTPS